LFYIQSTHHALHKLGQCKETKARDTVAMYASNIAANASVLCLDEFQVVDVADAMIIRRLLDQLWQKGVTLVTTSNRAPNDLYKNGLNRSQFVPCIEAIMAKCAVHEMRSGRDYRLMGHKNEDLYEDPRDERLRLGASRGACSSSENQNKSSGTWRVFTVGDKESKERSNQWLTGKLQRFAKNDRMVTVDVSVQGRRIRVNNASGGVARLTFNEICDAALGAGEELSQSPHSASAIAHTRR
jgi:predicted ATPase